MLELIAKYNDFFPFNTPPIPLTLLNMFLIWINMEGKKKEIANWFIGIMMILSVIPLINAIALLVYTFYTMSVPVNKRFFRKRESELKVLNTLIKCNHCKVMFRQGYLENGNHCPICNEYNHSFLTVDNQKVFDKKIPEQAKIKKNKSSSNELIKEQNMLYIKAKEERIRKINEEKE